MSTHSALADPQCKERATIKPQKTAFWLDWGRTEANEVTTQTDEAHKSNAEPGEVGRSRPEAGVFLI